MATSAVTIRAERPGDQARIREINDAAFGSPKNAGIVDAIRAGDAWIEGGSLVAEDTDGSPIGHLLLSLGRLDLDAGGSRAVWMIGPVAVVPERQRQGIGSALMWAAIALATERGQPVICLLGHADYYPRFGFEPARALGIMPARARWPDASWLALRLPDWDPSLRGTARFAAAFPDSQ
jgi:putative acetyltransferase